MNLANPTPQTNGAKPDKLIRDALKAAARQDPAILKRAAEAIWAKACDGDVPAFKEIADRIDGKVPQAIVGDDEHPPIRTILENEREALEHYFKIKGMKNAGLEKQKHEGTAGNS